MSLINNLYVHVVSESVSRSASSTSHPVEKGIPLTDMVKYEPVSLSISGSIVKVGEKSAAEILESLKQLQKSGSLITYKGRNIVSNLQIQSFSTNHPNTIWGGCEFSMTLKEVRIAKKAYTPPKETKSTAKVSSTKEIKVGSIVVFKGGNVYVSSDAKKAAAKRGRSTCKVTIINKRSWSVHDYHLISTDGGKVYGWVDINNIETSNKEANSSVKTSKSGGTQQIQKGKNTAVYHKVKKGETIWGLVNKTYKEYKLTCQGLINANPNAFSRKGDPKTLKIGAKLLISKSKR